MPLLWSAERLSLARHRPPAVGGVLVGAQRLPPLHLRTARRRRRLTPSTQGRGALQRRREDTEGWAFLC